MVETISAFAMKVRTGEIAEADFHVVRSRFLADIASHVVLVVRLLVAHFREADRLLQRHATSKRLRTLDALQLSVALDLKRRDLIDQFISSDQILVELALSEGLTAINPNP